MISIAGRIKQEEERIFFSIKNEYLAARKTAVAMQERIELQKKLVLDLNERTTQYSIMAREVETKPGHLSEPARTFQRNRIHGGCI